ncbi:MAG: leucine-rich repeat domain-containing protein [Thermoguttaceae bacterium]
MGYLARLSGLRTLDLRDTCVSAEALETLKDLAMLRELRFESPFDDEAIGCLRQMDRLLRLEGPVSHRPEFYLSDAGVAELAKLRCVSSATLYDAAAGAHLSGIDLTKDGEALSDAGLAPLWASKTLQSVRVHGRGITVASVPWDRRISQNVYLVTQRPLAEMIKESLDRVSFVEIQSQRLKLQSLGGPGPQSLTVSYETDECPLEMLRYFSGIRRLEVRSHHKQDGQCNWDNLRFVAGVEGFSMPLGLREGPRLDSIGLRRIGDMTNLRTLTCRLSNDIAADDSAALRNLKSLQYLELECDALTPDFMRTLGQLTDLRQLQVTQSNVNRDEPLGLKYLVDLQRLRTLKLSGLADADMPFLARLRSLQSISVMDHQISDGGFGRLVGLTQLRYLGVGAGISPERLEAIGTLLPPQARVGR